MELDIYAEVQPEDVRRGDIVKHKHGPIVVDELRSDATGIAAFGRPPDATGGPRRRVQWPTPEPEGQRLLAHVLPSSEQARAVWLAIRAGIETPNRHDALNHLSPTEHDHAYGKVNLGDGYGLTVHAEGRTWHVVPDLPPV